jgi:hypothetical protein
VPFGSIVEQIMSIGNDLVLGAEVAFVDLSAYQRLLALGDCSSMELSSDDDGMSAIRRAAGGFIPSEAR